MPNRTIGNTDISVSQIGLWCMGRSEFYGPLTDIAAMGLALEDKDLAVQGTPYDAQGMQFLNG